MNLYKDRIVNICDKINLLSLYAIAYFLPISKGIIESASILAILCFIIKKIIERKGIPRTCVNAGIFAYLGICFLSIFISSNFKISTRTFFAKVLQDIAFFFVVADTLNSKRRMRNFFYILFVSSFVLGIDGIYQHFTSKDFLRNRPYQIFGARIHACFPTPNDFGCYLATVIPFVFVSFFIKARFKVLFRMLLVALFILLSLCLFLTFSKGAWFASTASFLLLGLLIMSKTLFASVFAIFLIIISSIRSHLGKLAFLFNPNSNAGIIHRKLIWQAAWKMFMSSPWTGLGLGTFMFNFKSFISETYQYGPAYAHNCYLQMLSELGIMGLVSFLSILILFFYNGVKIINIRQKTFFWYILLASLASVLGYSVQMAVETIFYSLDLGMLFWILLGLGVAAMNNIRLEANKL